MVMAPGFSSDWTVVTDREDRRPGIERWAERVFGDGEPTALGTGWWGGVASLFLGVLACGAVLCLWFPGVLSTGDLRDRYPMPFLRGLIELVIVAALVLGAFHVVRRRKRTLGLAGIALALLAALAGGGDVAPVGEGGAVPGGLFLGLDWFLLNVLALALILVPLERAFPRLAEQGTFRLGWSTDTLHFFASHVLVQLLSFLTLAPALALRESLGAPAWIRAQPVLLQFVELVVLGDLTQYWVHRAFHRVPLLWRFHAIHHSSRALDWLAGSRLHLVDATATRALVALPAIGLGFAEPAFYAWLVLLSAQAIFVHANVSFRLGWLEPFLVTPRFHHWHHAAEEQAVDTNFAVQLPWLDRLFGTHYLPEGRWPARYGIEGDPVPEGFGGQLAYPFAARAGDSTSAG